MAGYSRGAPRAGTGRQRPDALSFPPSWRVPVTRCREGLPGPRAGATLVASAGDAAGKDPARRRTTRRTTARHPQETQSA